MTPSALPPRPKIIGYFKLYCVLMILCGFAWIALGGLMLTHNPSPPGRARTEEIKMAVLYFVTGASHVPLALVGIFLPRRTWAWTCSLVLLGLSLIGCGCMPAALLLLIQYIKPEVRRYYCGDEQQVS